MTRDRQKQLAETLSAGPPVPPLLLLPNAWDAMSARQFEAAGFGAIATTSGGVAWALGYRRRRKDALARSGRGDGAHGPSGSRAGDGRHRGRLWRYARPGRRSSVTEIIGAGAVGFNIEDGTPSPDKPVRTIEDASRPHPRRARGRARASACRWSSTPASIFTSRMSAIRRRRFDETVRRAKAYLAAGADCIYPFGLGDMDDHRAAGRRRSTAPDQHRGAAGTPPVAELERIGVARVSIASGATHGGHVADQADRARSCTPRATLRHARSTR